jgi:hypothetical protein
MRKTNSVKHIPADFDKHVTGTYSFIYSLVMLTKVEHLHVTYNDIHNLIRSVTPKIAAEFDPDLLIAIGMYNQH